MAKRFIDTDIFEDPWFMDLSINTKILYIYIITNCNHAGIIQFNWKLAELQTGIKGLVKGYETLIKELGNRLMTLKNGYYWLPKFIEYQYPGFPNSKVRSQNSAIDILLSHGISSYKNLTLIKPLPKGYENGNDTEHGNGKGGESERGKAKTQKKVTEDLLKKRGYSTMKIDEIFKECQDDVSLIGQKYLSRN